ncbi:MAG: alpha/beta hydrolase [Alphaproteobacteria bacterium]|nr:alpha/beta hydrolase [Alphaproteobacteria bacterium]MDE2110420.1 alpha/beta hydrolase [Alphaproteobacteria bacterium]MDE2493421.1 alpha/beta hydrolase [Alphaproteobacteria bacterium]
MISFPSPTMIKTNGIDMAVYEAGPKDGIPVVLCHGFPELAYSWRHQLPALAAAGYRVVAPDQRGYGLTSRPAAVEQYDMEHLTADLVGMLDAFGIRKAVFCGHDWGGVVAWNMPLLHGTRVKGVIGLNTPFFARPPFDPITGLRAAYGDDMYMVEFQKPGAADAVLAKDVARSFRFFMRRNAITQAEFQAAPKEARSLALLHAFASDEKGWRGEPLLTLEESKVYVDTFTRTGFTGGINWYRNLTRNWQRSAAITQLVNVPSLMIMAEDDVVLPPRLTDGMAEYVPDLEKALIQRCGHWTQQECPDSTNTIIIDWLKRRFIPGLD